MRDLEQIYHNNFGISFYWKKESGTILDKVQLVFRETGFYLTIAELNQFCYLIEDSLIENWKILTRVENLRPYFESLEVRYMNCIKLKGKRLSC